MVLPRTTPSHLLLLSLSQYRLTWPWSSGYSPEYYTDPLYWKHLTPGSKKYPGCCCKIQVYQKWRDKLNTDSRVSYWCTIRSPIILDMINVIADVEKALVVSKDQTSYSILLNQSLILSKALTLFSYVKAEKGEEAEIWSQQRLVHEVSEKKPSAWRKSARWAGKCWCRSQRKICTRSS